MGQLPSCLYPHEKGKKANTSQDLRSGAQKPDPDVVAPCGGDCTIKSFHVSTQVCPFLTRRLPNSSLPVTMNWYRSDPDCFDTEHQFHNLGFHPQINYSSSLQGQSEFSHQKGNFHSLCLSFAQEGKTKRGRQEGEMLEFLNSAHTFPPWDRTQRAGCH